MVQYAVQQGLAAVAQLLFDPPAVNQLPAAQGDRQRPLLQLRQGIAKVAGTQLLDPYQQRAGVVLAAAVVG
ncbi:hypothetical protein D9M71_700220 [compost metagenome]